jgi:hypothetical protein
MGAVRAVGWVRHRVLLFVMRSLCGAAWPVPWNHLNTASTGLASAPQWKLNATKRGYL